MKTRIPIFTASFAMLACLSTPNPQLSAAPLGTAFTYQGRLTEGGTNASGIFDLRFAIFDSASGGNVIGPTNTLDAVPVTNGLFNVTLDFGPAAFDGSARWLEIGVRTNGSEGEYTTLTPRQSVLPTPYALRADTAGHVPAANLTGTLPDARLSTNVALLNSSPTFTGTVTASLFRGQGALPWQEVTGTNQAASPNTAYLANNVEQVTITLPEAPAVGDVLRVSGLGAGGWRIAQNASQSILTENIGVPVGLVWTPCGISGSFSTALSADGSRLAAARWQGPIYIRPCLDGRNSKLRD